MIIAALTRPTGQLVISTENHPKTGSPMIVISHVRDDESIAHRTAMRPSEIHQVAAALHVAVHTLQAKAPQHRTISASAELERRLEEDRKLF
jgi:hypothetical protein